MPLNSTEKSALNVSTVVTVSSMVLCCRKYAPRCSVCGEPIMPEPGKDETVRVVALEKNFHMKCYKCEVSLVAPLLSCLLCPSPATGHLWSMLTKH